MMESDEDAIEYPMATKITYARADLASSTGSAVAAPFIVATGEGSRIEAR